MCPITSWDYKLCTAARASRMCFLLSGEDINIMENDASTQHLFCYINLLHLLLIGRVKYVRKRVIYFIMKILMMKGYLLLYAVSYSSAKKITISASLLKNFVATHISVSA